MHLLLRSERLWSAVHAPWPTLPLPAFQLLSVGLKQEATPLRHQHKWEWPETLGDGYRQAFLTQQCAMLGPADLTHSPGCTNMPTLACPPSKASWGPGASVPRDVVL